MERNLESRSFGTKKEVCKWVSQYQGLIEVASITYDSFRAEFVVFFYFQ